jgi:hypothetical protein
MRTTTMTGKFILGSILFLCMSCYANIKIPLDTNVDRTQLGDKVGRASSKGVLWGFYWGDAGTQAAAQDGGLTIIHHLDREVFVILGGLYSRKTTVAYGE